jgi:hypothetical protein
MKNSASNVQQNFWMWIFLRCCSGLLIELFAFTFVGISFHRSIHELTVPFIAFAIIWLIELLIIWCLKLLLNQDTSSKNMSQVRVIYVSLFFMLAQLAAVYSVIQHKLITDLYTRDIFSAMFITAVTVNIASLFYILRKIANRNAKGKQ